MKTKLTFTIGLMAVVVLALAVGLSQAQGPAPQGGAGLQAALDTAFTYQGQLKKAGNPVNDTCSMAFRLYDDPTAGSPVGNPITTTVTITGGLFTVPLDFGAGAFQGDARWLQIAVKCTGDAAYTTLSPRQKLTPAPYALALPGLWTQPDANNLIGGYSGNSVGSSTVGATIGGGGSNTSPNSVTGNYGTIGGGHTNTVGGYAATVGGGRQNTAGGQDVTIGGGAANNASGQAATIAGGNLNTASGYAATVSGGGNNTALGDGAAVGGGMNNKVSGGNSVIGGGAYNTISATVAVIGGGHSNLITGTADYATVGGGQQNTASGFAATVGGGHNNVASNAYATVGGGYNNQASGSRATVGGGLGNTASDWYATVGGGRENTAGGDYATTPGGYQNTAAGDYSFAAGRRAKANHTGAFVWADSTDADFSSTADNQFAVRATGGVTFTTGSAGFLVNGNTVWHAGNDGPGSGLDADTLDGLHASAFASAALLGSSSVYEGSTTQQQLFDMSSTGWAVLTDGDSDWDHTLVITTTNVRVEYTLWYGSNLVHGEAWSGSPATITFPPYLGFQLILARGQYIASLVCNENDDVVACVYQKSHP